MQNPETLSARVLKALYYPKSNLLDSTVGSAPSQVWRAIHEGIQVLKRGLIRRVGSGEQIDLVNDQWIPREGMLRPMTCLVNEPLNRVADFISSSEARWDEETLQTCFIPIDVEAILEIPLSSRRQEDTWAWHHERKVIFSIRSAYNMMIRTRDTREAWLEGRLSSSNEVKIQKEWSLLWCTKVPSKV
jgi:hypothetical protein